MRTRCGSYRVVGFVSPWQLGRGVWDPGAIVIAGIAITGQVLVGTGWTELLMCLNECGFSGGGNRVRNATF